MDFGILRFGQLYRVCKYTFDLNPYSIQHPNKQKELYPPCFESIKQTNFQKM